MSYPSKEIIVIMAVQIFVWLWPLFSFLSQNRVGRTLITASDGGRLPSSIALFRSHRNCLLTHKINYQQQLLLTLLPQEVSYSESKSKLYYDRQSVGQSVLVSGTHLGPATNFSHFLFDYFWTVSSFLCGTPSLTISRVCTFQFLLAIASAAFFKSESHGTREQLSPYLSFPQPGGPGSCIYFSQEQGSPVIPPGIGFMTYICG
jgi:hypothetical protein